MSPSSSSTILDSFKKIDDIGSPYSADVEYESCICTPSGGASPNTTLNQKLPFSMFIRFKSPFLPIISMCVIGTLDSSSWITSISVSSVAGAGGGSIWY